MSNEPSYKWILSGIGTAFIFFILENPAYFSGVEDFFKSVFFSEKNKCKILQSTISMPIEMEKGLCFRNDSNTQKATIQLVTRNAVKYTNFKGAFSCYTGETCSFGWPDAPKFHVISDGHSEKKMYIVGER